MNTKNNLQIFSVIFRMITIILILTNFAGALPAKYVHAESDNYVVSDDATGGDCIIFGNWDSATKTCVLQSDVIGRISIVSNGVVLDGNGHTLTGPGYNYQDTALMINGPANVLIKNFIFQAVADRMIYLYGARNAIITNNTFTSPEPEHSVTSAIFLQYSTENFITNNRFVDTGPMAGVYLFGSQGNHISNNVMSGHDIWTRYTGVVLEYSDGNTIENNTIIRSAYGIWLRNYSSQNLIFGNAITDSNQQGIYLGGAPNNNVKNNTVSNDAYTGILLDNSPSAIVEGNVASNNFCGINLISSGSSTLRDNRLSENTINLCINGDSDADYENNIDTSNLSEGKPIWYVLNVSNIIFDSTTNASAFYCIHCDHVTIKDLVLVKSQGVFFWKTQTSSIRNISVTDSLYAGISLYYSPLNILDGNSISNDYLTSGIYLKFSDDNTISGNILNHNGKNIYLDNSNHNKVVGNTLMMGLLYEIYIVSSSANTINENTIDSTYEKIIYLQDSTDNLIYRNNFNTSGASVIGGSGNLFSQPAPIGGNYWSNYDSDTEGCSDINNDGYCDTPYTFSGGQDDLPWVYPIGPMNQAPIADASGPYAVIFTQPITLDASASFDPDGDSLTYEWDLDNDGQYDDANGITTTISFDFVGEHIVGLRVADDKGASNTDTAIVTVLPWTLKGFYQPVDINGIYNIVKGGSTVPFKFEIFAGTTELTDVADVKSFTYAETTCNANAVTDEVELTVTGGTSLRYDTASGQFIYNWKTPKMPGKCYRVTLITLDGSSLVAYFKLK
jgi:parallel beta-helix repeat protein